MSQYPSNPQHGGPDPYGRSDDGSTGMAIGALVCGILAFVFPPLGIVALILGIVYLSNTRDGKPGRGMAMAGTILGGVGLVFGIIAILIAILLPALGAARRTARQMQNSTQLRGIHQGMVIFAQSNKSRFPGLDSTGDVLADGMWTGNSGDGNTPQARYWILLDGDFFTPEYAISPSEIDPIFAYSGSGPVTKDNYSYALLNFEKTGEPRTDSRTGDVTYSVDPATSGRVSEWSETLNSQAIVASDRNTGSNGTSMVDSIHSGSPGFWEGAVLWNDNHVAFERSHVFETRYGSGTLNLNDNIFEDDGTGGYDALMVTE